MSWKPLLAGVLILATAAVVVGLVLHYQQQPKEMRLPGTVEIQEVRLSSRVGGRVAKVLVSESQLIEPGQVIVELEMPELDAQRGQLVAQKEAAQAVLERLQNGPRPEEIAASKGSVDAAEARLARMREGYRPEEVAPARDDLQALEADLQNAQQGLTRERALQGRGASSASALDAAI